MSVSGPHNVSTCNFKTIKKQWFLHSNWISLKHEILHHQLLKKVSVQKDYKNQYKINKHANQWSKHVSKKQNLMNNYLTSPNDMPPGPPGSLPGAPGTSQRGLQTPHDAKT